jgi:hypothetical protein
MFRSRWSEQVMTIQDLGSVGEFLAAVATIATIAYLAGQLRQNTATVRAAAAAAQADAVRMISMAQVQSEEITRLYWDGLQDRAALDQMRKRRFDAFMSVTTQTLEQMWKLNREGIVDQATWQVQLTSIRFYSQMPGFRDYWKRWGGGHHPEFGAIVDRVMNEPPPRPDARNDRETAERSAQAGPEDSSTASTGHDGTGARPVPDPKSAPSHSSPTITPSR